MLFIDLETTGLDSATGQIIELALIDDYGRCLLSTRYGLDLSLDTQSDTEINAALEYNKLSRIDLEKFPPFGISAVLHLARLLENQTVVAHNVLFDSAFILAASARLLGRNAFKSVNWQCSMAALAKSKGIKSGRIKLPNMQLGSIPHSALSDVQNCRLLWQSLNLKPKAEWAW